MNKKQLLNAIDKYLFLNDKEKDILVYFILICSELTAQFSIYTYMHIANITRMSIKQAQRAITSLKRKNIIVEIENRYKNKIYQFNLQQLENIIAYTEKEKLHNEIKMSKKCLKND